MQENAFEVVQEYVHAAADEHGVDPGLINSIIHNESSFKRDQVSETGNMGYMQISSAVAKKYGVTDPLDPEQNIQAGTQYLSYLINKFGGDTKKAIAAYHKGETAVARNETSGPRTRGYLKSVTALASKPDEVRKAYKKPRADWKPRTLYEHQQLVK